MQNQILYVKTPLLESIALGKLCGLQGPVYLKMENVQPSGSFKIRGISNLVQKSIDDQGISKLVTASGGNAGMATAYVGRLLQIPVTVVIPESTPKIVISILENEGANVQVIGKVWNESQTRALQIAEDESTLYIHPYDHPLIWEGHASLVDEIIHQCPQDLSAIVLSVGGGGMLCGVLEGLLKNELNIPVIAMETDGAHCFGAALKAGKPVSIGYITSIAKTLGALSVSPHVFDLLPHFDVISKIVTDKEAVDACVRFANDHRALVEVSCGATLAAAYSPIISELVREGRIKKEGGIVFIVCGGNGVTLDLLQEWKSTVGL